MRGALTFNRASSLAILASLPSTPPAIPFKSVLLGLQTEHDRVGRASFWPFFVVLAAQGAYQQAPYVPLYTVFFAFLPKLNATPYSKQACT